MNYEIDLSVHQAAVPLLRVADVIATYTATLGGTIPRLEPTYIESYERNLSWLLDEVRLGDLEVCNERGKVITFGKYGDEITFYSSTIKQLNAWGDGNYVFTAVDMPLEVITFEMKDENGNVAHYDGFVAFNKAPLKISILPMAEIQENPSLSVQTAVENNKVSTLKKKPIQQQLHQENEILRVIIELGHIATSIPKHISGKPGLKAQVRESLNFSENVFEKAWGRLRNERRIKE